MGPVSLKFFEPACGVQVIASSRSGRGRTPRISLLPRLDCGFPSGVCRVPSSPRRVQDFILKILETYRGELDVGRVAREVFASLPEGDERLRRVEYLLTMTGVVRGEFGFVEAYRSRLEDKRPTAAVERA